MERKFYEEVLNSWLPGAMFPSELWWLVKKIKEQNIEVVIECGRQDGFSTMLLADALANYDVKIYSIDFDEDVERKRKIQNKLEGRNVVCVSGDIHIQVPKILSEIGDSRFAIVQDGPKGWEGMSTLLASLYNYSPTILAQHNLHVGHVSRDVFSLLAPASTFLEYDIEARDIQEFRTSEIETLRCKSPNRDVENTSLGLFVVDAANKPLILKNIEFLRQYFSSWSPSRVASEWEKGNYRYVSDLKLKTRYTFDRFKKR